MIYLDTAVRRLSGEVAISHVQDSIGWSLLHLTASNGNLEVVRYLVTDAI